MRHHLSEYDCGGTVGRLEIGQSVTQVASGIMGRPDFLFLDDNTPTQDNGILRFSNVLSRNVSQRNISPQAMQKLKIALREEWVDISQILLDSLKKSMHNR
ncbi:hypothetical protein NPIL_401131 [Nephila pilipes]|uniref:Uncharacterized protein n=1 Tax=Nephila pilipes TaxID=299642 RepID=A0A8X6QNS0_NEPPI|nr:hypothetical protein NPIL_401131 [Nephila pilipes]